MDLRTALTNLKTSEQIIDLLREFDFFQIEEELQVMMGQDMSSEALRAIDRLFQALPHAYCLAKTAALIVLQSISSPEWAKGLADKYDEGAG